MKIFQVFGGFCHWDATAVLPSIDAAAEMFAPDIVFVEAPDYVREGWGFDETAEGDTRFIRPVPPEGWLYDDETGAFYQESDAVPASEESDIWDELAAAYESGVNEA